MVKCIQHFLKTNYKHFRFFKTTYNFKYLFWPIVSTFFRNPSYAFVVSPLRLFSIFLNSLISFFLFGFAPLFILIPVSLTVLHACSPWVSCGLVFISEMVLSFSSGSFLRSISSHLLSSYLFQELLPFLCFCFLVSLQAGITFFSGLFILLVFSSCRHSGSEFLFVLWRYFYSDSSYKGTPVFLSLFIHVASLDGCCVYAFNNFFPPSI